jgi:protein-S-isoprenylcysteine O-methyltransferase Ste14
MLCWHRPRVGRSLQCRLFIAQDRRRLEVCRDRTSETRCLSILLGVSLRFVMPRRFAPASLATPVGVVLVLASIALFIAAVRSFRTAGTPVPGDQPTTTIVRRGPYRFSRNPNYLSFYGFQLGIAFWTNNLWQLVALVATVLLIALVVVPREECYLESRLPATYLPYKASTRRWL